jgi:hypothetical protein
MRSERDGFVGAVELALGAFGQASRHERRERQCAQRIARAGCWRHDFVCDGSYDSREYPADVLWSARRGCRVAGRSRSTRLAQAVATSTSVGNVARGNHVMARLLRCRCRCQDPMAMLNSRSCNSDRCKNMHDGCFVAAINMSCHKRRAQIPLPKREIVSQPYIISRNHDTSAVLQSWSRASWKPRSPGGSP